MGYLINAVCQCGYESEMLQVGVGFSYVETGHAFTLAYCNQCKNVQTVVKESEPPKCETCNQSLTYYEVDTSNLCRGYGSDEMIESPRWHCPSCKTNNLRFECTGLWD